jgi:tetratricopeptide (TPR) repeat protein
MVSQTDSQQPWDEDAIRRLSRIDDAREVKSKIAQLIPVAENGAEARAQPPASLPPGGASVGVWERQTEDGQVVYVRPPNSDPWKLWADVERIPPKGHKSRVVFLGESVARSFLLDPFFNCAGALETLLRKATGADDVEVVDLARNGLSFNQLRELYQSALALEPDAFVIFAGNNWQIPNYDSSLGFENLSAILRGGGSWRQVAERVDEAVSNEVRSLVGKIGALSEGREIPVVFIIPEFNLLDWQRESSWQNPLLTGAEMELWRGLREEARRALDAGDDARAAELAEQMIQIDEGLSPCGLELLARCRLKQGQRAEARALLERASDVALYLPVHKVARCYSVTREALRREVPRHGFALVDLPRRMEEYSGGELPGNKFFLDYCHMSVEGTRLAMALTAEQLLPLLGKPKCSWTKLNEYDFQLDPRVLAQAHIRAAVWNARYGQGYELLRFHCAEAARHRPELSRLMMLLAEAHVRRAPYFMCRGAQELVADPDTSLLMESLAVLAIGTPLGDKELYVSLVQALTDVAAQAQPRVRESVEQLFREEHGLATQEIDLLQKPYYETNPVQLEHEWPERFTFFKSFQPETRFRLVCRESEELELSLNCRVHDAAEGDDLVGRLFVNGEAVHSFPVTREWRTRTLELPRAVVKAGLNTVVLQWPAPKHSKEAGAERAAERLEFAADWQRFPEIYPVYGEVSEFTARARRAHDEAGRETEAVEVPQPTA